MILQTFLRRFELNTDLWGASLHLKPFSGLSYPETPGEGPAHLWIEKSVLALPQAHEDSPFTSVLSSIYPKWA